MAKGRPKGFSEEEALEKAMETFWREGYAGASMAILLKDMGISRQSLYDTFGDKRALYLKAMKLYINREVGEILGLLEGSRPIRAKLRALMEHFRATALDPARRGFFISNSLVELKPTDLELGEVLTQALSDMSEGLRHTLQAALDAKELSSTLRAEVLARGFLNSLMGLVSTSKAALPPQAIEDALEYLWSPFEVSGSALSPDGVAP